MGLTVLLTDTSRWSVSARLAIALSKAGCNVFAICASHHPLLQVRQVQRSFRYGSVKPLESLRAAIGTSQPDLIVPCDERGVRHLHELFEQARAEGERGYAMARLIEHSLGSAQSYAIVTSRRHLLKVASEEKILIPDTEAIGSFADLWSWSSRHEFPWVLKSDCTHGGAGVEIVESLEQGERSLRRLAEPLRIVRVLKRLIINRDAFWIRSFWKRSRPGIVVQAYVQGFPANCAVVCWKGRVLAGIAVEVLSSVGRTGPAAVVRIVDNREMMQAAEKIAARLCLSGFFGLDFMISSEGGAAYLIEMNPRCTTVCHLRLGKGRDMIGALLEKLTGQSPIESEPVTQQDTIAYFPQAWTSNENHLYSSFEDIPEQEPRLVDELLHPWPDRTLLYRLSHALMTPRSPKS